MWVITNFETSGKTKIRRSWLCANRIIEGIGSNINHIEYGRDVNANVYFQELEQLKETLMWKYPELVFRRGFVLVLENAGAHPAEESQEIKQDL